MSSLSLYCVLFMSIITYHTIPSITGAPATATDLEGTYELTSDPMAADFAEYLEALGVNQPFREVMRKVKINLEVSRVEDGYKYKVITPLLTREVFFKFGEELEDTYVDGRKYKTIFTFDGENVKQDLKFDDNVSGTNIYKFTRDGVVATLTAKDKVAVRTYKRI